MISRQVQHLARMTDDLLAAARATTGKVILQRQPLSLAEGPAGPNLLEGQWAIQPRF